MIDALNDALHDAPGVLSNPSPNTLVIVPTLLIPQRPPSFSRDRILMLNDATIIKHGPLTEGIAA